MDPQNAVNRDVLRRLSVQPEDSTEAWIIETLNIVVEAVRVGADNLSGTTGLSVMLSRLYLSEQLRRALRSTVEWGAGEARADGDTLANIAEAAQLSLPSLRRTFPTLDDVVKTRQLVEETGQEGTIQIHNRSVVLKPFGTAPKSAS